jgi:hypothetical protein
MWRILETELVYNRFMLFLANLYCFVMLLVVWFGALQSNRPPLILLVLLTSVFLASYTGEEKRVEQRRERLQSLCPLPIWQIGLMKNVYPLVIWINTIGLYLVSFFLLSVLKTFANPQSFQFSWMTGPSLIQMITLNGWILVTNSVYLIVQNLRISSQGGRWVIFRIIQVLISFVVIIPFLIITNFLGAFGDSSSLARRLSDFSFSSLGSIGFNILGVVLFVLSVFVFSRRRSYAKS